MASKLLMSVPAFAFHAIILSWINKIEKKCECSTDWRRDFMKYFSIVSVLVLVGSIFVRPTFLPPAVMTLGMVWFLAALVNIGAILSYIPALRKKQCDCALEGDWRDDAIFWYMIASIGLSILMTFIMLARK
jgi:hypothetical protein